jgi:hypothetical protein
MNHHEHPDDSALTRQLRDCLSELAAPGPPPLAAITTSGRAHQRRRLTRSAGLAATGAAACTALALGLTGIPGTAPARGTATTQAAAPARGTGPIQAAAFTLTRNANGTDTLTLTPSQLLDPAALQQALAHHDIPALVKTGTYCSSSPAAPDPASIGVLSIRPPAKPRQRAVPAPGNLKPGDPNRIAARTVTVINPAAMPPGTELFFGYSSSDHALFTDLIYTSSHTCSSQPARHPLAARSRRRRLPGSAGILAVATA